MDRFSDGRSSRDKVVTRDLHGTGPVFGHKLAITERGFFRTRTRYTRSGVQLFENPVRVLRVRA